ncbi:MAG: M67 family metallopeptidase [Cyclobacteriaceae bacterium]
MTLTINKDAYDEMTRHAEDTFPYECVGFFYGVDDGKKREVLVAREVKNVKKGDQRRRFEVDPYDYFHAEKFAEKNGLTLLGIYHSHPNHPAIPSEHDLKQAVPYFSYIIISVIDGKTDKVTSWQLNLDTDQFDEEAIKINEFDKV